MTFYASCMEDAKRDGRLVKVDKTWISDGLQHPVRVVYQRTDTGEYTAKLNGEFCPVKRRANGTYTF